MKTPVQELRSMAAHIGADVFTICNEVLSKHPEFEIQSGSAYPHHHHYGDGGLARHELEVIKLMLATKQTLGLDIDTRLIFLAGFFHDIGKLWDYAKEKEKRSPFDTTLTLPQEAWVPTEHKRRIHHLPRSAIVWSKAVDTTGLFKEEHDEILHAILSHHGERAWGSPVAPATKLAWLLHLCDALSARLDDCTKHDFVEKTN